MSNPGANQILFSQSPFSGGQTSAAITLPAPSQGDGLGSDVFLLTATRDVGETLADGSAGINAPVTITVKQGSTTLCTMQSQDFKAAFGQKSVVAAVGFACSPSAGTVVVSSTGTGNCSGVSISRQLDR